MKKRRSACVSLLNANKYLGNVDGIYFQRKKGKHELLRLNRCGKMYASQSKAKNLCQFSLVFGRAYLLEVKNSPVQNVTIWSSHLLQLFRYLYCVTNIEAFPSVRPRITAPLGKNSYTHQRINKKWTVIIIYRYFQCIRSTRVQSFIHLLVNVASIMVIFRCQSILRKKKLYTWIIFLLWRHLTINGNKIHG